MSDSQKWLTLAFILVISWLTYILAPILMPFAFAAVLAYLGDPLADKLEIMKIRHYQVGRTNAVLLVFCMMLIIISAILIFLIPRIEYQISQFFNNIPAYSHWFNKVVLPWMEQNYAIKVQPIEGEKIISVIKNQWQESGKSVFSLMGSVSRSSAVLANWLMNLLLIPVITFYLLRDWDILVAKIHDLLPRRAAPTAAKLASETNTVLGAFLRGQFYVMLTLGAIYSIGLWLTGLNLAIVIGMTAGLISFVPYLGSIIGILVACIAAIFQFHDIIHLIQVAIVFIIGQSLEGMILTPWLVGDKIGLHPVAVIFAVLAGGQLFGFLGVLLALPLASVIMVILRHIHEIYRDSSFYSAQNQ